MKHRRPRKFSKTIMSVSYLDFKCFNLILIILNSSEISIDLKYSILILSILR